jgi:dihydroceramidase
MHWSRKRYFPLYAKMYDPTSNTGGAKAETQLDTTQLIDELSMIYTTCILFYAAFSQGRSTSSRILLSIFLAALALFITLYYHYLKDPVFHQNMFALLTTIVVLRSIYVMEMTLRPSRPIKSANGSAKAGDELEEKRAGTRDEVILRTMRIMVVCGVFSVALGFGVWNLDNIFCSTLRRWRKEVGLPWGILLEGHGWW